MKIALIGRDSGRVLAFRGSLIRLAQREGHDVIAITAPASAEVPTALVEAGVRWFPAPLDAGGVSPMSDLNYRREVEHILRSERVDSVLAYNPKCLAHAPIAARRAGVGRVIGMVTGLGHGFIGTGLRERLVRFAKARLYRRSFAACDRVLVQNAQDLAELDRCGALPSSLHARAELVPGSGVDLVTFAPAPLPKSLHFLMIARPLREKGLPEFLEAARRVRDGAPDATFTWLGSMQDPNPSTIDPATLRRALAGGAVRHLSERPDVRPVIAASSVFVLPSHREGTSKVMLEAMAMGRAVLTTDAPGCGHVVEDGRSGFVFPRGDVDALVSAMRRFVDDPRLAERLGAEARDRAERIYDSGPVDSRLLGLLTGS